LRVLTKRVYFLLIAITLSGLAKGQILDDTTKLSYGPRSTKYLSESDLRYNSPEYRIIDTTLFSSYRKNKVELYNYYYHDLGIEGSAMEPIFYELPLTIGVSPGQDGFAPYYKGPLDLRYYDTRSPYSRMTIFLGGGNRSITDVEFSRSDSVNFNIGFDFKTFAIDKLIERDGRGDRRASATQYDIYSHVQSSNLKYQLLLNYTRNRHVYNESGGIDTTDIGDFFNEDVLSFLDQAESAELRKGFHLYHQYSFREFLEVYNTLSSYRQRNEYIDQNFSRNSSYYDTFLINTAETLDSMEYKHKEIESGIKGTLGDLYYSGHWRWKEYEFMNKYADSIPFPFDPRTVNRNGIEVYYGFDAGYKLLNNIELRGGLEYLKGGYYEGYAQSRGKNFELSYRKGKYKPTFLQQAYFGNSRFWANNFRPVLGDSFKGEYSFNFKDKIIFTPTFKYDLVTDYIYFDKDTLPAQEPAPLSILTPGLKFKFEFLKHFGFDGNVIYTMLSPEADSVMAMPEIFIYTRLYYRNTFFSGNLESFIGLDLNFKSAYFGQAYDPVTQQFYLQDHTLVEGVPVANLFLNFKIKRANFFIKMNNLTQMITDEGYLVAPLYRGLPPTTDFGITFWFFD